MIAGFSIALAGIVLLGLVLALRGHERQRLRSSVDEVVRARERGSDRARLQHPYVDRTKCFGCGLCVAACPEDGVLDVVLGQARVVHGSRCVGHARCAAACPVDAIAVTLGDTSERTDLPALTPSFEAVGSPGLFLAGEVTGFALVRTAVAQGTSVGRAAVRRTRAGVGSREDGALDLDLVIVGAGPAGIACALTAREAGLDFVVLEKDAEIGGSVASYPRRKLVMTQPMELPLHGSLPGTEYAKEELIELWRELVRAHGLPVRFEEQLESVERDGDTFAVTTRTGRFRASSVCLAIGRRGVPRRLGVPGEASPRVSYSLLDARSYAGRNVLVVGGGDSAVEAALGLAAQTDTGVTLSYRKADFFRLKARNEAAIRSAIAERRIDVRFATEVLRIEPDAVVLASAGGESSRVANDDVFVFAGGEPPFELLRRSGVSFDPADRPVDVLPAEQGSGIRGALIGVGVLLVGAGAWLLVHHDYYALGHSERPRLEDHGWLRPSRAWGLAFGLLAVLAALANLGYLLRRAERWPLTFGRLRSWMTVHVATGSCAWVLAALHSGMAPRATSGGRALLALSVLVATGIVGRYLYSYVPRAATGSELELEETQARLVALEREWDREDPEFRAAVSERLGRLVDASYWTRSLPARVVGAFVGAVRLRSVTRALRRLGREQGVDPERLRVLLDLARRRHHAAIAVAWYDEVRGLMATWRYLHRWVALGMLLLVALHVADAVRFARLGWGPLR